MSLKLRLNLIITGLLLLVMLAGIGLSFNNARKNTLAEISSAEISTLYLFDNAIAAAIPKDATNIDLSSFKLQQLSHMRHLKIELLDSNGKRIDSNQVTNGAVVSSQTPAWFERMLNNTMPQWQPKIKTLSINNQLVAKLVITPDPTYEYAEIWKQITDLMVLLAIFFICVNLMIAWAIAQALKPTESILHTLNAVEKGDLAARLPHFKLPEMARIGQKFNHMIETLQKSIFQNHKLTQQLITLQEEERKSLARDLHDEFGQCLTAINTDASVVLKHAKTKYPELKESALAITELSRHLIDLVSGLLRQLRPGVLNELGLTVALHDLVDTWRARHPQISSKLNMNSNIDNSLGEAESLAVYRLVQESLTNISRHANASEVAIHVESELKLGKQGLVISVSDNGDGFHPNKTEGLGLGLGLAGMRERVEGLGGALALETLASGTKISAWIPTNE